MAELPAIDLATIADSDFKVESEDGSSVRDFQVRVLDNTEAYLTMMKSLFDFEQIKGLLSRKDFSICIDGMHGVAGPYANAVFLKELGVPED